MKQEYAFPQAWQAGDIAHATGGLTIRDYFAAHVMAGFAANPESINPRTDANLAYRIADAMLAERAKGGEA